MAKALSPTIEQATKILMDDLEAKIKVINDKIDILEQERQPLDDLFEQLSFLTEKDKPKFQVYDIDWEWSEKVIYILKRVKICLSISDLVHNVLSLEPERNDLDREVTRKAISGAISNHVKYKTMCRYKENKKYYIGLPEWFVNGEPKKQFKYYVPVA